MLQFGGDFRYKYEDSKSYKSINLEGVQSEKKLLNKIKIILNNICYIFFYYYLVFVNKSLYRQNLILSVKVIFYNF